MNAIAVAFTAAVLAGGAAYAHETLTRTPSRQAGTLTCTTKPDLSLVFGRTPVADCTFVSDRGDFKQTYAAMLSPVRRTRDVTVAETMTWSVMTADGFSRPSMISGPFTALADHPDIVTAKGARDAGTGPVSLRLVSHSGQRVANFALGNPRIDFAAVGTSLAR
ncbi:hypothetical protein OPKNFCMD_3983 [Methylobacterium crusticola]|uniref:DUF992 domain-containing protein n=1 Tax=Methylobacterium crusticola TaxID=1697972 RepID=A0ABQ4R320_9HYPH|nr:DUF992 domain-containing protein [Methylobacterium crusticola]GJD51231.1 hypothetical protein OPKNFCMD_3983 [Methylobacterium crusticola]